jgi:hypothetical protein
MPWERWRLRRKRRKRPGSKPEPFPPEQKSLFPGISGMKKGAIPARRPSLRSFPFATLPKLHVEGNRTNDILRVR